MTLPQPMPNGDQPNTEELQKEIEFLNSLVQDSQLIIGQQQVALLRQNVQLQQQDQQMRQMQALLDGKMIAESAINEEEWEEKEVSSGDTSST